MIKKIVLGFIGLIIIIVVAAAISDGGSTKESKSSQPAKAESSEQAQASPEPELLKVKTVEFIAEFDKNQLAAEQKYKGKQIEFTAFIKNISEDILGKPFLSLNPTTEQYYLGTSVQCFFSDKSALTPLANGQSVTLQGKVDAQSLGTIMVKDCKVVS